MAYHARGLSTFLIVLLVVGIAALAWAVLVPITNSCVYPSADYGICGDNAALKQFAGAIGGLLVIGSLVALMLTRHQNPSGTEGGAVS